MKPKLRHPGPQRLLTVAAVLIALIAISCSTTRRIEDGEQLYVGVEKLNIKTSGEEKLPDDILSQINSAVNAPTNNPWPFLTPQRPDFLPIGLWVYNNWNDTVGGLRGWMYDKLAREPRLVSGVRAESRTEMISSMLDNNGYFGSTATYEVVPQKNNKKAKIRYNIDVAPANFIDTVIYFEQSAKRATPLQHFIDSVARKSKYLQVGEQFCVDSLDAERIRITNSLRNRGYYFFRPEFIVFLADTFMTKDKVAIKLSLADNLPELVTRRFKVGNVITKVNPLRQRGNLYADTMQTSRGEVIVMQPAHLRDSLIPECITFRKGRIFSVRDMDRTQTRLSRLGIFGNIQISPQLRDTASNVLDVLIDCKFDQPMEASVEVNASSKSNSYIGPGLTLGLTHHNLFGGGEKLNVQATASYEWQTGRQASSVFNSYEFGLNATLAIPRLLAPSFFKRTKRDINWTKFTLGGSILNRPHYFKMWQTNLGMTYEWSSTRYSSHQFTPFKLTYTKLMKTTEVFDSIMEANPAVAQSFNSQFIPEMNYTYTYDKFFERERINGINFQLSLKEAGNVFWGVYELCGKRDEKKMFGTPFSQFVKGQVQLIYNRRLIRGTNHWWVSRILVGAEHAYGNSTQVPYAEQFYIGGANSIRAFTVRSLGPGSYRSPRDGSDGYFDQTGTFKFEFNTEYRFPLMGMLNGAVFIDTGNVWLLKKDADRPGGTLTARRFLRDLALGTGVGLRFDMGMLVVRADLGYGLHAPYDTGHNGYFNIRFKDAFAFHLAIGYPF